VDSITILDLTWEQHPERQAGEVPQLACQGRIQVTYILGAG